MEILDTLYELEGLLLLSKERGGITPEFKSLIEAKTRKILRLLEDSQSEGLKAESETEILQTQDQKPATANPAPEVREAEPEPQESAPEVQIAEPEVQEAKPEVQGPEPETATPETPTKSRRLRLSLNDRLRFSRTLFSGNTEALDRCLTFVESLPEREDVEDYFFSELEWDPTDRETAEFVEMVLFLHSRLL